jgi:DNA-binding transcriptional MerR regulator
MKKSYSIIRTSSSAETQVRFFDHQTTARLARVTTRSLLKYWRHGLIKPLNSGERYGIFFDEQAIYRIRKAESIRASMKTNIASAAAILSLVEEIEKLRSELKFNR